MTKYYPKKKRLSNSDKVNRRRHVVLGWMMGAEKKDGKDISNTELAKQCHVSVTTILNDKKILRTEYAHVLRTPEYQLEVVNLLKKADSRNDKCWAEVENILDNVKQLNQDDPNPELREELRKTIRLGLEVNKGTVDIGKVIQPKDAQIPGMQQQVNVQGDFHQGNNQYMALNDATKFLEEQNPKLTCSKNEDFVDISEEEIGKIAGGQDVIEPEDDEE